MFHGYFAKEYPQVGIAEVCYYDQSGCHKIQTYCVADPEPGTTRNSNFSVVPNPVEEARRLVSMLNGGRDFARIADELKAMRVMLDGYLERIANKIDPTR